MFYDEPPTLGKPDLRLSGLLGLNSQMLATLDDDSFPQNYLQADLVQSWPRSQTQDPLEESITRSKKHLDFEEDPLLLQTPKKSQDQVPRQFENRSFGPQSNEDQIINSHETFGAD